MLFPAHSQESVDTLFKEPFRPQFHFSPEKAWMNDPNGMVYHNGEYHLFFQYYPNDTVWGPMHWGHAISKDLVNWEELPVALEPDELGYIFSGSAVYDENNTSGLGSKDNPPLVALYTYHDPVRGKLGTKDHETQGLAYSLDNGRTWQKYANNPVISNTSKYQDFRDPKVFWYEQGQYWVMALSVSDHVQFWRSDNLINWNYMSSFGKEWGAHGGVWECPDLIEMPVQGSNTSKWVLLLNLNPGGPQGGSGTQYFVGDFDGERFTLDNSFMQDLKAQEALWLDVGRDNYASVSWSNVPEKDGRTLIIGWMSNWDYAQKVPTHPWRSAMTLPREIKLNRSIAGFRLSSEPVEELLTLRGDTVEAAEINKKNSQFNLHQSEILLTFDLDDSKGNSGFKLSNGKGESYRFMFDPHNNLFISDRSKTGPSNFSDDFARIHTWPREISDNMLSLRMYVDKSSIEIFINDGRTVFTETFFPSEPYDQIEILNKKQVKEFKLYPLKRIW